MVVEPKHLIMEQTSWPRVVRHWHYLSDQDLLPALDLATGLTLDLSDPNLAFKAEWKKFKLYS